MSHWLCSFQHMIFVKSARTRQWWITRTENIGSKLEERQIEIDPTSKLFHWALLSSSLWIRHSIVNYLTNCLFSKLFSHWSQMKMPWMWVSWLYFKHKICFVQLLPSWKFDDCKTTSSFYLNTRWQCIWSMFCGSMSCVLM